MNKLIVMLAALSLTASCNCFKPEKRVHRLLTDRTQTLAVAESCTGGTIAARFTAMPGASAYFKGGVVAYWNQTKELLLGISRDTIARYGVVSEEIVRKMAEGVRHAGRRPLRNRPPPHRRPFRQARPELPVGSVWIAVSSPERTVSRLIRVRGNRSKVIRKAGSAALSLLEEEMLTEKTARYNP